MGDEVGNKIMKDKIKIIDDEGNVIDTIGVTSIGVDDIMPEEIGNKIAEEVFGGSVELDVKIPRISKKRFKKLMMSKGYGRNMSERLHNVYKNMYGRRSYIGLMCFLTYIDGMKFLGEDLCII